VWPVGAAVFSFWSVSNAATDRTPAIPPRTELHRRCFSGMIQIRNIWINYICIKLKKCVKTVFTLSVTWTHHSNHPHWIWIWGLFAFLMFSKAVSYAHQGCIYLIKNTVKQEYIKCIITVTVFYFNIFLNVIYSFDGKAEFTVLHDLVLNKHFLLSVFKQFLLKLWCFFWILWQIERLKELHLSEMEIF